MMKQIFYLSAALLVSVILTGCEKQNRNPTVTDLEGYSYGIIKIGNQVWMTENLRVGVYRDGSGILSRLYADFEWASAGPACALYPDNSIDGLNSESEVVNAYGLLYNWTCATDPRGLCPQGYHVPTRAEWQELVDYLGGEEVAGGKLKSKRTDPNSHPRWEEPNTGATDGYHFHALPGGFRSFMGWYDGIGYSGAWWATDELSGAFGAMIQIYSDGECVNLTYRDKNCGLSVRCIQD